MIQEKNNPGSSWRREAPGRRRNQYVQFFPTAVQMGARWKGGQWCLPPVLSGCPSQGFRDVGQSLPLALLSCACCPLCLAMCLGAHFSNVR